MREMITERPPDLRQQKRDKARAELAHKALKLFSKRGFEETTVDDIVATADVSRRTFFRYFGTKEDVVLYWIAELGSQLRELVISRPPQEPPLVAARNAARELIVTRKADYSRPLARLLNDTPSLRARYYEHHLLVTRAVAEGIGMRLGVPPDALVATVLASITMSILQVTFDTWAATGGNADLDNAFDSAFDTAEALFLKKTPPKQSSS